MLPRGGQGGQTRQRPDRDRHRAGGHFRHRHGVRRAVSGRSGHGHAVGDLQHQPFGRGPCRPALPCGADERGIGQCAAEGHGRAAGGGALSADGGFAGGRPAHHPEPLHQLCRSPGLPGGLRPLLHRAGRGRKGCSPIQCAVRWTHRHRAGRCAGRSPPRAGGQGAGAGQSRCGQGQLCGGGAAGRL